MGIAVRRANRLLPEWRPIRELILDPTTRNDNLLQLVRYQQNLPLNGRRLAEINEPREAFSLYVEFGPWSVFLPYRLDSMLYSPERRQGNWTFNGRGYEYPRYPTFGLTDDWEASERTQP